MHKNNFRIMCCYQCLRFCINISWAVRLYYKPAPGKRFRSSVGFRSWFWSRGLLIFKVWIFASNVFEDQKKFPLRNSCCGQWVLASKNLNINIKVNVIFEIILNSQYHYKVFFFINNLILRNILISNLLVR